MPYPRKVTQGSTGSIRRPKEGGESMAKGGFGKREWVRLGKQV